MLDGRAVEPAVAAGGVYAWTFLLIAFPAFGALVLLLGGRRTDSFGHVVGTLASLASFVVAALLFIDMLGRGAEDRAVNQPLFEWLPAAGLQVSVGLLLDQLSMAFVLLITGVGTLIHIYSMGYMQHDPRRRRFFGYLNLFIAAMLLLVLADDYLVLYVGWEGVGLASYLLIGFWQHKNSAAVAAKKAFVVNRVGDMGMTLAVMAMFAVFGTTAFSGVLGGADQVSEGWLTVIGLLLLLAACGKSAQFPLQSWLLDAMEGPTPVSALIHAATMVTAGVYLITRSAEIYAGAPIAQTAVVVVGTITLVIGAVIGCAKDDIKRVLAGSTMSQIGYMVLAAGLGPAGYAFAIFHLLTHGFFKANLFLGAGSVMHAMDDEVDMRVYGGLRRFLPLTFLTFAAGYLAIIGVPPFAGFWSKDRIIEAAFADNLLVGACALLGSGITAFYMTRVMLMTWFNERRWKPDVHAHESPLVMTLPLLALGLLSLVGGAALLWTAGGIVEWLEPVVGEEEHALPFPVWIMTAVTLVVVVAGVALAWVRYGREQVARTAPTRVSFVTTAARRDLYGDTVNEVALMRPGQRLTRVLVNADSRGLDRAVNGVAALMGGSSGLLRQVQTGFVRSYALSMLGGTVLVVVALLSVRLS
ncbi:MAG: NADH-quinone oxidoreductase subunit L [Actinomycetota bacterium]|nr:NADH-quinone oxidoreductase subunit L [Actinomycetota bacterium]